jgi:hypothetical protein
MQAITTTIQCQPPVAQPNANTTQHNQMPETNCSTRFSSVPLSGTMLVAHRTVPPSLDAIHICAIFSIWMQFNVSRRQQGQRKGGGLYKGCPYGWAEWRDQLDIVVVWGLACSGAWVPLSGTQDCSTKPGCNSHLCNIFNMDAIQCE